MKSIILITLITLSTTQLKEVAFPAEVTGSYVSSVSAEAVDMTPQQQGFISVAGTNLSARMEAAIRQGRAANAQGRFWTAWAFDVRPGVAVDYDWRGRSGNVNNFDGTNVSFDRNVETRNLGIFVLHEKGSNSPVRVEVYNLDRQREYSSYPVYWLARANNDESLNYLKSLADGQQNQRVSEHSVLAIALHDDNRVSPMLRDFVRGSGNNKVRNTAVFWIGQIGGETQFLSDLVTNQQENTELRKQAAFAIGVSRDEAALSALQKLYQAVSDREVKKQVIFAASVNDKQEEAVNFLINLATNERDIDVRKQAIFWLGQKAGERSLKALGDTVNSNDADTEVQKQAVFAISQRPKDEAVPLLIRIAKTHAKAAVRKQAIFWLGQTGDDRAVAFFKEILTQ